MVHFYLLLIIPLLIGVGGWLISRYYHKGSFCWKEMLCQVFVGVLLAGVAFKLALCYQTTDREIWNSRIAKKWKANEVCVHTYRCMCTRDSKGNETCQTCYRHSHDVAWYARTEIGEQVYSNTGNSPGSSAPGRWEEIVVGEPTAVEHRYTNYIKGNPDSILRRRGAKKKYGKLLPEYPRVYDHYRIKRVLSVGLKLPEQKDLNKLLMEINAKLGHSKQVNIIVIVVASADRGYLHGLEEHWLGGKKNDVVVVVGAPEFPKISWAGVMSWSNSEEMKLELRDRIEAMETFQGRKILKLIEKEVQDKFVRRPMSDFSYLRATISPSQNLLIILYFLVFLISGGLQTYFWVEDPFE